MIKSWIIKASAPICGTDTYYRAYSEQNPLDNHPEIWEQIVEELWDNFSYNILHLDDEDYNSEEERDEAYDQAYEDWRCDCNVYAEEATEEDFKYYAPGGNVECLEVIYDERND